MIDRYISELLKTNKNINITRITDPDSVRLHHIEDSLSAVSDVDKAPEGLYGDMGSGGGFPGVPIALATGRKTILIDSVKKKMKAVQEILIRLGLDDQIKTYGGRLEELALERPGEFAVLTARALSKLSVLMELASPLLMKGGYLICLKSHPDEKEIDNAIRLQDKLGIKLIDKREFFLSDNETYRMIFIFEKISEPKIKLPRKNGAAQNNPL